MGSVTPLARGGLTMASSCPMGASAYQAYVEGGWGTIGVPIEHGGQGMPFVLQTAVLELLGTANTGFALCPTLTVGAIEALVHHGSADQQALYLPHLATGAWTGTMNLTEPQAGSDVGALRTQALPRGDGTWSIKGTKIYISYGDHDMAENIVHLVLARTPNAPAGTRGISLFLLNNAGRMMTRSGFEYILEKHAAAAARVAPTLATKSISPRVLRHSCAMHMLQATRDIHKVALWLGHATLQSTEICLRADPTEKLEMLDALAPLGIKPGKFRPPDKLIAMLASSE
jgi:alkylation response protein AidB-like acyl-CoA dehydrogenase